MVHKVWHLPFTVKTQDLFAFNISTSMCAWGNIWALDLWPEIFEETKGTNYDIIAWDISLLAQFWENLLFSFLVVTQHWIPCISPGTISPVCCVPPSSNTVLLASQTCSRSHFYLLPSCSSLCNSHSTPHFQNQIKISCCCLFPRDRHLFILTRLSSSGSHCLSYSTAAAS